MEKSNVTAQECKEKGNEEYKRGNWTRALSHYTNALELTENKAEKAVYYKNRAAANLMLHNYEKVVKDCDSALEICRDDPKALFRRCQALKALNRFEEAYQDAEIIISCYKNNKVIQPAAARLHETLQMRLEESARKRAKVFQLLKLAFNVSADKEKRETAMTNLLELAADDEVGIEICQKNNLYNITQLVKLEKNEKLICSAIRIVGELCKNNIDRTEFIVQYVGLPWCLTVMNSTSTERINASQYCLQNILNTYSGANEPYSKSDEVVYELRDDKCHTIMSCLLTSVSSRTITGLTRDAIIEFIMRNLNCVAALDWAGRLLELDGLKKLMEVASEMKEYTHKPSMDMTSSTRTLIRMCLAKIYENVYCDDDKNLFIQDINKFIDDKLQLPNIEPKMRIVLAITAIIYGPLDVAEEIIFKKGIFEIMLAMSKATDVLQQKVVCECIVAAATKFKQANVFLRQSKIILENLYQSRDDSIRVQAFVGFCKLSRFYKYTLLSYETITPFADKETKELAEICLINIKKEEEDTRIWVIIGLSYLTTDAEVKEKLIEDQEAIQAMIELAKTDDQSVLYAVIMTLVNLCNAYDDAKHIPEMNELLTFGSHFQFFLRSKKLNSNEFVNKRLCALVEAGVTSALVNLAKTNSQNYKELIARVFNAICSQEKFRQMIVQQGGTEALLLLALDGTDKGKKHASRALVYLGLTIRPEDAFPGQISMEVVWPIINLLNPECSVNENCDALTVLLDLANVNDSMRKHIFNEAGFEKFADYVNSNHYMLKLRSAQLLNNLALCREVDIECRKQDNSKVMSLVLNILCEDDNKDTYKAMAGELS